MSKSIGAIELRSISKGFEVADNMVKTANVEILFLKSICPGRFIVILAGDVGAVNSAIEEGRVVGKDYILDSFILNAVHEVIIAALKSRAKNEINQAIGIMETNSVCSGLEALDATLKGGDVNLIKLQLAFGIGGKLIYIISGGLSDVEYGMTIATEAIDNKRIVNISIIPSPDESIIKFLT